MTLTRHLPRFRQAYRELKSLKSNESWDRATIDAHQLRRLNTLWEHATTQVAHYRELKKTHGLPSRFDSLDAFYAQVPVLDKTAVRDQGERFLADHPEPGKWHLTGGSTATPTRIYHAAHEHHAMLRNRYRFQQAWDVDIFDRWAYLWGHNASFVPGIKGQIDRLRQPIEDRLRRRLRLSAYRVGPEDMRQNLEKLVAFKPIAIYAYSSVGYLLALEAEKQGIRLPSLKMVNLTAEPAFPHIVQTIERAFGVPAVQEYGSAECGFLAGAMPDGTVRVREDNVILETTPRDDGRFDILVTNLGSTSFPLIRYRIGDVTTQPLQRPDQGFAILTDIGGRDNDLIIGHDDQPIHNLWFDEVFDGHPTVRRYRINQSLDGDLKVLIELNGDQDSLDQTSLKNTFSQQTGQPVSLEIVEQIPSTAAGKHRTIISELAVARTQGERHKIDHHQSASSE